MKENFKQRYKEYYSNMIFSYNKYNDKILLTCQRRYWQPFCAKIVTFLANEKRIMYIEAEKDRVSSEKYTQNIANFTEIIRLSRSINENINDLPVEEKEPYISSLKDYILFYDIDMEEVKELAYTSIVRPSFTEQDHYKLIEIIESEGFWDYAARQTEIKKYDQLFIDVLSRAEYIKLLLNYEANLLGLDNEEAEKKSEGTIAQKVLIFMLLDENYKLNKAQDKIQFSRFINSLIEGKERKITDFITAYRDNEGVIHKSKKKNQEDYKWVKEYFLKIDNSDIVKIIDNRLAKIEKLNN
jgi:hypothetical protein